MKKKIVVLFILAALAAAVLITPDVSAETGGFAVSGGYTAGDTAGGAVFELSVENGTDGDADGVLLIAAVYNGGRLTGAAAMTLSLAKRSVTPVIMESGLQTAEGAKAVVMLWEGIGTMKPLAAAAVIASGSGTGTPGPKPTDGTVETPGPTLKPAEETTPAPSSEPDPTPHMAHKEFEPTDELLINPHIGFMTFASFNGSGYFNWDGSFPESVYDGFGGYTSNPDYVDTSIAYIRMYWRILEPQKEAYNWEMVDRLLRLAEQRGQTLMFRIMVTDGHSDSSKSATDSLVHNDNCAPAWFRATPGIFTGNPDTAQWGFNHNNSAFYNEFSRLVKAFAERYDGHRYLDSVDIAFVGHCGENLNMNAMQDDVMDKLVKVYVDSFKITPLIGFLTDHGNSSAPNDGKNMNHYVAKNGGKAGLRADSFGDMGFYAGGFNWNYMMGSTSGGFTGGTPNSGYPWAIDRANMKYEEIYGKEAWELGPITFETCWTFKDMYDANTGRKPPYNANWSPPGAWNWIPVDPTANGQHSYDIDLIIDKANEWHTSSINGKSSAIPLDWQDSIYDWIKQMGYRFCLAEADYTVNIPKGGSLEIRSTWHNLGVAPIYHHWYEVAYRLKGEGAEYVFIADADITEWMPGEWVRGTFKWNSPSGSGHNPSIPNYKFYLDKPGYLKPSPDWKTDDTFTLPEGIAPGRYELQTAIVNAYSKNPDRSETGGSVAKGVPASIYIENDNEKQPMIKLANVGRKSDGWMTLGEVNIK